MNRASNIRICADKVRWCVGKSIIYQRDPWGRKGYYIIFVYYQLILPVHVNVRRVKWRSINIITGVIIE